MCAVLAACLPIGDRSSTEEWPAFPQEGLPKRNELKQASLPQSSEPRFRPTRRISVPPGFQAQVYATGLVRPTAMAFGPDGRLYVTQEVGDVVVVGPGVSQPKSFASGFDSPLGLDFVGSTLYVSGRGTVYSVGRRTKGIAQPRVVIDGLPFGLHQQDNIVAGPDDRLYLGSGSTCDRCEESDPRSAAILSLRPDGSDLRVWASGLRNPFGLAFHPQTGELYASVNGIDDIGTDVRPEPAESIVAVEEGAGYGWPDCWPSYYRKRLIGDCEGVTPPIAYLEPHSSADGIAFYTGTSFPAQYAGDLFVAEWGEYYSDEHGRKVVRVKLGPNGIASSVSGFAEGFTHPLAVAVDQWGALLVADWEEGVIYRIQARTRP
jgi:glucose/arabinose dehydrogenase